MMVTRWLDHHEWRRQGGVPTISVLRGPVDDAARCLSLWSKEHHRPLTLVQSDSPRLDEIVLSWMDRLVVECNLVDETTRWLTSRLNWTGEPLDRLLQMKTPVELAVFLDGVLPEASNSVAETACRWILSRASEELSCEGLASRLDARLVDYPRPWLRVITALGELVASKAQPVLALVVPANSRKRRPLALVEWSAMILSMLALSQARLSLVLIVEPALFRQYLDQSPVSRAKTLLLESVISVDSSTELRPRLPSVLAAFGATESLTATFREAHKAVTSLETEAGEPESVDRARSAAERFLFECLQAMPETTGLFELNKKLGFRFGSNRFIEADLAADPMRLVVEIDGYYHFQNSESYRRDRRKDLEFQKHGYLVVRVLAEDVVGRLEDVLDTVRSMVALRRGLTNRP
jgi:very-short-patch-repair endonuclease